VSRSEGINCQRRTTRPSDRGWWRKREGRGGSEANSIASCTAYGVTTPAAPAASTTGTTDGIPTLSAGTASATDSISTTTTLPTYRSLASHGSARTAPLSVAVIGSSRRIARLGISATTADRSRASSASSGLTTGAADCNPTGGASISPLTAHSTRTATVLVAGLSRWWSGLPHRRHSRRA
jgi:hypothetical protein